MMYQIYLYKASLWFLYGKLLIVGHIERTSAMFASRKVMLSIKSGEYLRAQKATT